jgi:hypothetical protein
MIISSLVKPPPEFSLGCILSNVCNNPSVLLYAVEISALACNPNTSGYGLSGRVSI